MPINKTLKAKLIKQYGVKEAKNVYFGMENSKGKTGKIYKKGLKTATKEKHIQAHYKTKKKTKKKGKSK